MEELGNAVTDLEPGRGGQEGIVKCFRGGGAGGGAGGTTVRGRDVGADPKDRAGAG